MARTLFKNDPLPIREILSIFYPVRRRKLFRGLTPRQQTMITLHYGLIDRRSHSLEVAGRGVGLSVPRAKEELDLAEMTIQHNYRTMR